jgi:hypothetical protein
MMIHSENLHLQPCLNRGNKTNVCSQRIGDWSSKIHRCSDPGVQKWIRESYCTEIQMPRRIHWNRWSRPIPKSAVFCN